MYNIVYTTVVLIFEIFKFRGHTISFCYMLRKNNPDQMSMKLVNVLVVVNERNVSKHHISECLGYIALIVIINR